MTTAREYLRRMSEDRSLLAEFMADPNAWIATHSQDLSEGDKKEMLAAAEDLARYTERICNEVLEDNTDRRFSETTGFGRRRFLFTAASALLGFALMSRQAQGAAIKKETPPSGPAPKTPPQAVSSGWDNESCGDCPECWNSPGSCPDYGGPECADAVQCVDNCDVVQCVDNCDAATTCYNNGCIDGPGCRDRLCSDSGGCQDTGCDNDYCHDGPNCVDAPCTNRFSCPDDPACTDAPCFNMGSCTDSPGCA